MPIMESGNYTLEHVPLILSKDKDSLKGWVIGVIVPIWDKNSYRLSMNDRTDLGSLNVRNKSFNENPMSLMNKDAFILGINNAMVRDVSKALENAGAEVIQYGVASDLKNMPYGDKKRMHALIVLHPGLLFGQLRESYKLINNSLAVEAKGFFYSSHRFTFNVVEPLSHETIFKKTTPTEQVESDKYRKTWLLYGSNANMANIYSYQAYSNRSKREAEIITATYNKMLDNIGKNLTVEDFMSHKSDVMELKNLKRF